MTNSLLNSFTLSQAIVQPDGSGCILRFESDSFCNSSVFKMDGSETNPTKRKLGIETSTNQKRRLQVYRPVWEKDFPELRPVPGNAYKAKCTLCVAKAGEGFSISHGGVTDVTKENPGIIKSNCCAHIVHNCCKSGMMLCP